MIDRRGLVKRGILGSGSLLPISLSVCMSLSLYVFGCLYACLCLSYCVSISLSVCVRISLSVGMRVCIASHHPLALVSSCHWLSLSPGSCPSLCLPLILLTPFPVPFSASALLCVRRV